jgi:hypothetical protein
MSYDVILFVLLTASVVTLSIYSISITRRKNKMSKFLIEILLDNQTLRDALEELRQQNTDLLNIDQGDQTDGFIRFLEETRESAYTYIEKVQGELAAFDKVIRNDINKINADKKLSEKEMEVILKRFSKAVSKIENILPQENSGK